MSAMTDETSTELVTLFSKHITYLFKSTLKVIKYHCYSENVPNKTMRKTSKIATSYEKLIEVKY